MEFFNNNFLLSTIRVLMPAFRPQAYLDPGSGSFILQLIVASLLGILFVMRRYWNKIFMFLRNLFTREDDTD
jgi:hypothetical protein